MTKASLNPPISVCIIGMNEEKKVEDCIKSVLEIADEIIFLDSGSTDRTLEIVKKYTDKVFHKNFFSYVEQKNAVIELANNNWILSLDCDERLSTEAFNWIKLSFSKLVAENPQLKGFKFSRLTFYIYRFIRHSGWYPDNKIRLFHKDFCTWKGNLLHESMQCEKCQIQQAKGDILHYSFDNISDHLRTIDKFSEIAAREAFAKGKKSGLFTIIGRTAWVGIRKMIFEAAWLDGMAGIILTGLSMTANWTKYSRLYLLWRENKERQIK